MLNMIKASTFDEYCKHFPLEIQEKLVQLRSAINEIAPEAKEAISYGMPAYKYNGKPLVYFAAQSKHIGFYGTPSTHVAFEKELSGYKRGKGSVQFPLSSPLPISLIKKMTLFKLKELQNKAQVNP
ncbi:iron chaperone [Maribacter sp. CXY002]|uniref:iron chaperone n=1 Tax=Maribacter luteocoastalis TaxID=3407671 RepID=UPI003B66FDA1